MVKLQKVAAMIAKTLDVPESSLHGDKGGGAVRAPGMLRRHYAPGKPLRLNAVAPRPGEAYLGWGALPAHDGPAISLSLTADIAEAAANLFALLHRLDAGAGSAIAVAPIPEPIPAIVPNQAGTPPSQATALPSRRF